MSIPPENKTVRFSGFLMFSGDIEMLQGEIRLLVLKTSDSKMLSIFKKLTTRENKAMLYWNVSFFLELFFEVKGNSHD